MSSAANFTPCALLRGTRPTSQPQSCVRGEIDRYVGRAQNPRGIQHNSLYQKVVTALNAGSYNGLVPLYYVLVAVDEFGALSAADFDL
jgi:hypothetical protein